MKVFLTGANGFIGLPTIRELVIRGHHVLALTRSDAGAKKILFPADNMSDWLELPEVSPTTPTTLK